ncbi:HAD family hydrolase [Streptomyces montanisoli]|uniref:HAD family phosphatase n=1 Tax=Streptomyces montanisoli TaxID=2798581 RepID=A0A940M5C1_9ACTN|nr:HAD family phosphatase [Streptomyces montanisoli]MBP0456404.1 HAD family phosphatase [Streptomyces montanisoli]
MTAPWAVLFDLDGTLVDTEPLLHDALSAVLGAAGVPASALHVDELRGRGVAENLSRLSALVRPSMAADELYARVSARLLDRLRAGVAPLPGAVGLLGTLRRAGVPRALVSSSYRAMVDAVLPSLGPAGFAVTLAGDEVRRPKPDPDPYRTAAAAIGFEPGRCVVIEDSAAGIRSALAAGCLTVSVTPTREPVALAVPDLTGLTVDRLAGLVRRTPGRGPRKAGDIVDSPRPPRAERDVAVAERPRGRA